MLHRRFSAFCSAAAVSFRLALDLVRPGFHKAWRVNRGIPSVDWDEREQTWVSRLKGDSEQQLSERRSILAVTLSSSSSRLIGLEQKGIGLIQASAIILAVLVLAVDSNSVHQLIIAVLVTVSLIYLSSALLGAIRVVMPRKRFVVGPGDTLGETGGASALAVAIEDTDQVALEVSNYVRGAVHDLARSGAIAIPLLLLIAFPLD